MSLGPDWVLMISILLYSLRIQWRSQVENFVVTDTSSRDYIMIEQEEFHGCEIFACLRRSYTLNAWSKIAQRFSWKLC